MSNFKKITKKNVAVVFGGKSVEHDISIITGLQILHNLDIRKYRIVPIYISKENIFYTGNELFIVDTYNKVDFEKKLKEVSFCYKNSGLYEIKGKKQKFLFKVDFAFLALHGGIGERGSIQGLFDVCNIPYSSCGVLGSSICMDKYITKLICSSLNINVVKYVLLNESQIKNSKDIQNKIKDLKYPLIVKPNSLGSSIGVNFCKDEKELKNAVSFAFMFDSKVLIEEVVSNLRELNMAVVGNKSICCDVSLLEEVTPKKEFLTFESKYLNQNAKKGMESLSRIVPANVSKEIYETIKDYSIKIYNTLDLSGCVRIDYLLDNSTGQVYLNEVNTIPGSLANYLFKNKNFSFLNLLEKIMDDITRSKDDEDKKITRFTSSVLSNYKNSSNFTINK